MFFTSPKTAIHGKKRIFPVANWFSATMALFFSDGCDKMMKIRQIKPCFFRCSLLMHHLELSG